MLRMRLNPHFLFNSLQNISTLARQNPDAASQMLARLGDVLRATLLKGTATQATLAAEIALTRAYVEVEQIRFGGRLSVLFEVDRQVDSALVPSFFAAASGGERNHAWNAGRSGFRRNLGARCWTIR